MFVHSSQFQCEEMRKDVAALAGHTRSPARPKPPMFCYLKPYYNDPNKNYFQQLAEGVL